MSESRAKRRPMEKTLDVLQQNMVVVIFVALAVGLSLASPYFLTPDNILNVLRQVAVIAVLSVAFSLVLGAGEIDLSIGSVMGLAGVFIGGMLVAGVHPVLAVVLGIVSGVLLGFLNAALITVFKINALITTIATMGIFRGIIYLITNTKAIGPLPDGFVQFGQGSLLGLPVQLYVVAVMVVFFYVLVNHTVFGRHAIGIGSNRQSAIGVGISPTRIRFAVYGLMGGAAGVAAAVLTARSASAQPIAGDGIELDVIAAVVIGGTALWGGRSRVIGALFGCLIVGMVSNGLNLMAVNANWQFVVKGILIIVAISLDSASTRTVSVFRVPGRGRKGKVQK